MDEKEFYDHSDAFQRSATAEAPLTAWRRLANRHTADRFQRALMMLETGQDFLELGCGGGELCALAMKRYSTVHGIDIASRRLEEARSLCSSAGRPEQVGQFLVGNLNDPCPFPDGSLDSIAAISVLEHVFDVYSFVRDCRRLLRPSGILLIEVPNLAYLKNRLRLLFGNLPITSSPYGWADGFGWDGGHLHYFTKNAITNLLTGEGFEVKSIVESRAAFANQRSYWVSLLAGNFLIKAAKT